MDPASATITLIVNYLQDCFDNGLACNTVRGRISAIQAYHDRYGDRRSLKSEPAIRKFMQGSFIRYPPVRDKVPSWELTVVLEALKFHHLSL